MSSLRPNSGLKEILKIRGAHFHFAGILGVSMSSLARLLLSRGYKISGSDARDGALAEKLRREGIGVSRGNTAELIGAADALIYSYAIPPGSEEMLYARERGIPTFSRAELLGELMLPYKHRIGISGTHGKSTTTAMIHRIFSQASFSPTTLSGAALECGEPLSVGGMEYLVYEACEYRGAFLHFSPECAVITSLELDHTDYYPDLAALSDSFLKSTKGATRVVLNADYPAARCLIPHISGRIVTYGSSDGVEYRYAVTERTRRGTRFAVCARRESLDFFLPFVGEHNVANATAAIAVSLEYGIPYTEICTALAGFTGIPRRLEYLFSVDGRVVLYDYAHHPTEIKAAIGTVKELYGECTVVFRPHTYTRTRDLWNDMREALSLADYCVLADIFAAREEPIDGVTSQGLAEDIGSGAVYVSMEQISDRVLKNTRGAILLMGAGALDNVKESLNLRRDI